MRTEAAVSRDGQPYPVIETLDLAEPRAGEVLVRIVASGICHTDLGAHAGMGGGAMTPKPVVLGHEGAGIVERVGEGVTTLKPGDHVVMSGSSCGTCPNCRRNVPSYCVQAMPRNFGGQRIDGSSAYSKDGQPIHGHFFRPVLFARRSIAPERSAVKIPDDMPLEIAAPMGCGVITGAGAVVESLKVGAGDSIAVFGVGGVGLSAVMAARLVGASRIVAVDVLPHRLALALELGATDVVDARDGDAAAAIREITGHGADFSFNTTTVPEVWTAALDCLAMRGTAGFVTAPRGAWSPAVFPMLAGGRKMQGILGGDAAPQVFIPMLVDYYRQGRFPLDRLIRPYAFEDIAQAFQDTASGETIKPVLRMAA
ncbi:MAG: NAD(P)-dependent alcohol dehydrogenase [Caulobacteraceae bacterium]